MFKITYLDNKNLREREINFNDFKNKLESYFLLLDKDIKEVNVCMQNPLKNGISMTFNNHVKIESGLYNCFKMNNETIIIGFKEFTQCFSINKNANITLDFLHDRMFLEDFNIRIYFIR